MTCPLPDRDPEGRMQYRIHRASWTFGFVPQPLVSFRIANRCSRLSSSIPTSVYPTPMTKIGHPDYIIIRFAFRVASMKRANLLPNPWRPDPGFQPWILRALQDRAGGAFSSNLQHECPARRLHYRPQSSRKTTSTVRTFS